MIDSTKHYVLKVRCACAHSLALSHTVPHTRVSARTMHIYMHAHTPVPDLTRHRLSFSLSGLCLAFLPMAFPRIHTRTHTAITVQPEFTSESGRPQEMAGSESAAVERPAPKTAANPDVAEELDINLDADCFLGIQRGFLALRIVNVAIGVIVHHVAHRFLHALREIPAEALWRASGMNVFE